MNNSLLASFIVCCVLISCSFCYGDEVIILKTGRKITGKIISRTETSIQVEIKVGKSKAEMTIPVESIERIEEGRGLDEEFQKKLSAIKPTDLDGYQALIVWCEKEGMKSQAQRVRVRLKKAEIQFLKDKYPDSWCRPCKATGKLACSSCEGKGEKIEPCPRCTGRGDVECRSCARKEKGALDCRRCGGAGVYERFDASKGRKVKTRCTTCSGKGKIECPTCNGKQKSKCEDCKGKGGKASKCEACKGKKYDLCKPCESSGVKGNPEKKAPQKEGPVQEDSEEETKTPKKKPVVKDNPFGR